MQYGQDSQTHDDARGPLPAQPPTAQLATWSWAAAHRAWKDRRLTVQPVRISLGRPKFWPQAEHFPFIAELAPDGWMLGLEGEQYTRAYLAKLDKVGVETITARFEAITTNPDVALALLCFEADRANCHRGLFARWWQERTGEVVPEIRPAQMTIEEAR
jgi:hypothetical protein